MPAYSPQAFFATGADFQQLDPRGSQLARVGLLWKQHGSTGTANTLLATGATLDASAPGDLWLLLCGALWTASATGETVAQLLSNAANFQTTGPEGLRLCDTIAEWITEGSIGTPSAALALLKSLESLSAKQLLIVEIVLVCLIYGIAVSASGLTTTAVNAGFGQCDPGQLQTIIAYLYAVLS